MRLKKRTEERIEIAKAKDNYWKRYRTRKEEEMKVVEVEAWKKIEEGIILLEEEGGWREESKKIEKDVLANDRMSVKEEMHEEELRQGDGQEERRNEANDRISVKEEMHGEELRHGAEEDRGRGRGMEEGREGGTQEDSGSKSEYSGSKSENSGSQEESRKSNQNCQEATNVQEVSAYKEAHGQGDGQEVKSSQEETECQEAEACQEASVCQEAGHDEFRRKRSWEGMLEPGEGGPTCDPSMIPLETEEIRE